MARYRLSNLPTLIYIEVSLAVLTKTLFLNFIKLG